MDFPIVNLLDDELSERWLLKHFHRRGLKCPRCHASVKLGVAFSGGGGEAQVKLLVDALNGLEKMSADQPEDRPTALVIDEFQKIIEFGGRAAEAQIRAAIQQHKRTGYVLAGSKTRMLTEMTILR